MTIKKFLLFILSFNLLITGGCINLQVQAPVTPEEITPPKDISAPFLFGKGKKTWIFATAGSNVLDVYRTKGPLLDYLGNKLNVRFRISFYRDYKHIVKAMINGHCHLAWLGPVTYLNTRNKIKCTPLAQVMIDGINFYKSVIIMRKGDGYSQLSDLKNKSFAFTNQNSTSGYIYPWNYLNDKGISPKSFFSKIDFAGSHSNAIVRLISGQYAAVAVEENALKRLKNKIDTSSITILTEAGNIPNGPIAAHPDLPLELANKIKHALINMNNDKEGRKLLKKLSGKVDFTGFREVSDKVYDKVRDKIEAVNKVTNKVEAINKVTNKAEAINKMTNKVEAVK